MRALMILLMIYDSYDLVNCFDEIIDESNTLSTYSDYSDFWYSLNIIMLLKL